MTRDRPAEDHDPLTASLLRLLHLSDSAFPVGAFAYSDGLETAVVDGFVRNADDLSVWLADFLDDVFVPCEGLAVRLAMAALASDDWSALERLDQELTAMRPSAATRSSSRTLGQRFLKSFHPLYGCPATHHLAEAIAQGAMVGNAPVVHGVAHESLGTPRRAAIAAFGYTRLVAMTSAALRLFPVGQQAAQAVLAVQVARLPALVTAVESAEPELRSFVPRFDVEQMNHRYVYSRMFRS